MEGEATLVRARRAAVHAAITALCARTGVARPPLPAVQGVCPHGPDAGGIASLAELVHRIGADAARYALVRTRAGRPVRLDLAVWARRDEANPLWRVQSVRARALLCLRTAAAYGEYPDDHCHLVTEGETDALDTVPGTMARAAELGEPHRIAEHLERRVAVQFEPLAASLTSGVSTCRDATHEQRRAYRRRLTLATRYAKAVAFALPLLGVASPDRL